ncbi:MAG: exopolysaccharide biosynthesis polyprenyl glycosylphosphotransferase [Candidatus Falkowbacteria bacterium]|nr:exopolysaccharide biosynthesis polyprenyl glycosylphosphotransferase [Candidatus Falkowbacteria bacterium]
MTKQLKKISLLLGDILLLNLALYLTLIIRYQSLDVNQLWQRHLPNFLIIFIIWLLIFYINNLYNLNTITSQRRFNRLTINSTLVASALSTLYFYLNVKSDITPKTNLLLFIIIFLILFLAWRYLFNLIIKTYLPKNNLAIIGSNRSVANLIANLQEHPHWGYQTAIIIKDLEPLNDLPTLVKEKNIKTVVIADNFGDPAKLNQALFDCLPLELNYFNFPDFYELLTGKIPVEDIDQSWFIANLSSGQKNSFMVFKRIFDFILAIIILIISLPFWPLIALLIRVSGPGPTFFRQDRFGQNGRIFSLLKFRSMRVDNNNFSPTLENDNRITRIGGILRKTRLDEIPQILNVVKGEMSFIGPRPERPDLAEYLTQEIPFYRTRLLIKPGLTGWDQISGKYHSPSKADTLEKLQYDLFYLKHRSLYLDLTIALKTLAIILSRSGR